MFRIMLCLVLVLPAWAYASKPCGKGHIADNKECHVDKPPAPHEHKGKPCGNSYIAHDKICHIGQAAPPEKPKISPAIIAAPVAAAAAVYAVSKPTKPAKIVMTGMCKKDIKLTVFSSAYDFMCFDNPLMCK